MKDKENKKSVKDIILYIIATILVIVFVFILAGPILQIYHEEKFHSTGVKMDDPNYQAQLYNSGFKQYFGLNLSRVHATRFLEYVKAYNMSSDRKVSVSGDAIFKNSSGDIKLTDEKNKKYDIYDSKYDNDGYLIEVIINYNQPES